MDRNTIGERALQLKEDFEERWGGFRRFIAANPLTGFWAGVVLGIGVGAIVIWIL